MRNLNYRQFLDNLNLSLDYTYFIKKEDLLNINENIDFLNNLFLAPNILPESRDKVFSDFLDNKLNDNKISSLMKRLEEIFNEFDINTSSIKIKMREYTKYIAKFITQENIKNLFEINKNNLDFIFYIVYAKYNLSNYGDVIELINFINKNNLIKKDNLYYNDILLYKLISLKKIDNNYLRNEDIMQEICKIAQHLFGFEFTRLTTLIECCLVSKDFIKIKELFNTHFEILKKWDVTQLVNFFELITYCNDDVLYDTTKRLLESKDILLLNTIDLYIFKFIIAVKEGNNENIEIYKNRIKNDFNLMHYEYYKEFLKK